MRADVSEVLAFARDIERNADQVPAASRLIVGKTGYDTVGRAQVIVPKDTRTLENSIGVDFNDDGLGFEAGPTAEYGDYVEEGTDPHWIDHPWGWDNVRVWHPGTAAQPYMAPAFDTTLPPALDAFGDLVGRAFRG